MALKFIDQEGTEHTVYTNQEDTFRKNYKKRTGSTDGWEKALRQSKVNQQVRETFGLSRAGSGLVTDLVSAPTDAEIRDSLKAEAAPAPVESFSTYQPRRPLQQSQPDEGYTLPGPVTIGLSIN